jgi:hypothetical protein
MEITTPDADLDENFILFQDPSNHCVDIDVDGGVYRSPLTIFTPIHLAIQDSHINICEEIIRSSVEIYSKAYGFCLGDVYLDGIFPSLLGWHNG